MIEWMKLIEVFGADFKSHASGTIVSRVPKGRPAVTNAQLGRADAAIVNLVRVSIPGDLNTLAHFRFR